VSRWISPKLYTVTGLWNLEDLIGHICYLVGMFALLYLVAGRLDMNITQFRGFLRYRIELPATVAIALMVATFVVGDIGDQYSPDITAARVDGWLRVYWLVMIVAVVYLIVLIGRILLILRRDPRSKRGATVYLLALSASALCVVAFTLTIEPLQWVSVRCEVISYAVAASYNWQSKINYLRGRPPSLTVPKPKRRPLAS
jgi:hypothetical protein